MKESNNKGSGARAVVTSPVDPASILTPEELATRLKVSPRWIYEKSRKRNANPLPVLRLGRYLRFDWLAVSAWMREQGGVS
jgi:predicted DNA-binding transcriptional regulator AlpA